MLIGPHCLVICIRCVMDEEKQLDVIRWVNSDGIGVIDGANGEEIWFHIRQVNNPDFVVQGIPVYYVK